MANRSKVHHVTSESEFNEKLKSAGERLVVVDFFADWCGPCKQISPIVDDFSNKYPNVVFLKVNVDELSDLAGELGVRAMPTFYLFAKGKKVDDLVGADPRALEAKIKAKMGEANYFPGGGNKLGSTAGATSSEPKETYVPPTTATVTTTSAPSNGNVTLRLPNGTTVKGQFTAGSTLQEVVNLAKQHISNCVLMGGWPPRALTSGDYSKTLGELALLNSVITVKNA
jgi:thioredoxin 1